MRHREAARHLGVFLLRLSRVKTLSSSIRESDPPRPARRRRGPIAAALAALTFGLAGASWGCVSGRGDAAAAGPGERSAGRPAAEAGEAREAACSALEQARQARRRGEGYRLLAESRGPLAKDPTLALALVHAAACRLGMDEVYLDAIAALAADTFVGIVSEGALPIVALEMAPDGRMAALARCDGTGRGRIELLDLTAAKVVRAWPAASAPSRLLPVPEPPSVIALQPDGVAKLYQGGGAVDLWRASDAPWPAARENGWTKPRAMVEDGRYSAALATAAGEILTVTATGKTGVQASGLPPITDGNPPPASRRPAAILAVRPALVVAREDGAAADVYRIDPNSRIPRFLARVPFHPEEATLFGELWLLTGVSRGMEPATHIASIDAAGMVRARGVLTWAPLVNLSGDRAAYVASSLCVDAYGNANEDAHYVRLARLWGHHFRDPKGLPSGYRERDLVADSASLGPFDLPVVEAVFSEDGSRLLAGNEGSWDLFDCRSSRRLAHGERLGEPLGSPRLSPDGRVVLSGVGAGTCRLWRIGEPGRRFALAECRNDLIDVDVTADGRHVAAGGSYGDGFLFDRGRDRYLVQPAGVADWNFGGTWPGVPKGRSQPWFAAGDSVLVVTYLDPHGRDAAVLYDVAAGSRIEAPGYAGESFAGTMIIDAGRERFLLAEPPGIARVVDLRTGRTIVDLGGEPGLAAVCTGCTLERIAAAYAGGAIRLFDGRSGERIGAAAMAARPLELASDRRAQRFAALGIDGSLHFFAWSRRAGLQGQGPPIANASPEGEPAPWAGRWQRELTLSACGRLAVLRLRDKRLFFDVEARKPLEPPVAVPELARRRAAEAGAWDVCLVPDLEGPIRLSSGSFSVVRTLDSWCDRGVPDGLMAFGVAADAAARATRLVSLAGGETVAQADGELLSVDPTGHCWVFGTPLAEGRREWIRLQVFAFRDGRLQLRWSLGSGAAGEAVTAWSNAPVRGLFAAALQTGEVFLADLAAGGTIRRFRAHDRRINAVVVAGDPPSVFTASDDNTVRIWPVDPASLLGRAAAAARGDPAVAASLRRLEAE